MTAPAVPLFFSTAIPLVSDVADDGCNAIAGAAVSTQPFEAFFNRLDAAVQQ